MIKSRDDLESGMVRYFSSDMWFDEIIKQVENYKKNVEEEDEDEEISIIVSELQEIKNTQEYINYKSEQLLFINKIFNFIYNNEYEGYYDGFENIKNNNWFEEKQLPLLISRLFFVLEKGLPSNFELAKDLFDLEDFSFKDAIESSENITKTTKFSNFEKASEKYINLLNKAASNRWFVWEDVMKNTFFHYLSIEKAANGNLILINPASLSLYQERAEHLLSNETILSSNIYMQKYFDTLDKSFLKRISLIQSLVEDATEEQRADLLKIIIDKTITEIHTGCVDMRGLINAVASKQFLNNLNWGERNRYLENIVNILFPPLLKLGLTDEEELKFFNQDETRSDSNLLNEIYQRYERFKTSILLDSLINDQLESPIVVDTVKVKSFVFKEYSNIDKNSYSSLFGYLKFFKELSEKIKINFTNNSFLVTIIDRNVDLIDEKEMEKILFKALKIRLTKPLPVGDLSDDELININLEITNMVNEHSLSLKFNEKNKEDKFPKISRKKV